MSDILKRFRKCCFCRKRDDILKYIPRHGIYGFGGNVGTNIAYHEKCLYFVCDEPRQYSNIMVDKAVEIVDLIKYRKKEHQNMIERLNYNCKYLKENCIGKQNE